MSTFDIRLDAPGILRIESLSIALKFDRTGPTTGRVSWNIPTPAAGCTAEDQAYCGMLVALDTTPASSDKIPESGVRYTGDPTASTNLFAGDKLGTAFVIGAFYEDRTTTFFDVTGLSPNTAYYVSGYPVDCQDRYYVSGVHAYSQDFRGQGTLPTSGTQAIALNGTTGVKTTDITGLMCGVFYDFEIQLGVVPQPRTPVLPGQCVPTNSKYTVTVDGCEAAYYSDLIVEINKRLSLLTNPPQSPFPPNANALYWNNTSQKLFVWDGYEHVDTPVIVEDAAPNVTVAGPYWYNPTTEVLRYWNGATWDIITVIEHSTDPQVPVCDQTYWLNSSDVAHLWNGTTWCAKTMYYGATDPSLQISAPCGSYWVDLSAENVKRWNDAIGIWDVVSTPVVRFNQDPLALTTGTYWFDTTTNTLYAWDTPVVSQWNEQINVSLSETAPATPAVGKFWYNPTSQVLQQWDGSAWVTLDVIVHATNPSDVDSCGLWWNTDTEELNIWDSTNSQWDQPQLFFQDEDPTLSPEFVDGDMWYNADTEILSVWQNICFVPVEYIDFPTDPTSTIPDGTVWFDGTNWFVRSTTWVAIDPIETEEDPSALPSGTYWFNTTNDTLAAWNGVSWVNVTFSTTPYTPTMNSSWFDTTVNTLMIWNGSDWVAGTPIATVELDCYGNLLFTDTSTGSLSFVGITDITMFKSLNVTFRPLDPAPGTDGVSNQPSYAELGIGTDGSNDERLKLMNEVRYELGYPTIDVELTQEQLDYAVSRSIEEIRGKTGVAYKHGFFFMRVQSETQRYLLTNKTQGFNKIVSILGIYRLTSAFLSSAHGAGVYGQIVMQHLYNMGTFDLLSYHLMAEYTELMEILFAGRITFTWSETSRELWIHHRFPFSERMVLIEATVERTEQDIMSDRWCRSWIRRFALATAREILAETRGKFSTLPGAGGGITLNASDLRSRAIEEKAALQLEIEDYIVDRPDDHGMGAQFVIG